MRCTLHYKAQPHAAMLHSHEGTYYLMPLRCSQITCDALRCIFQHVGNSAPDFGISQLFTTRFSNGFHHNAGNLMSFPLMCVSNVYAIYF